MLKRRAEDTGSAVKGNVIDIYADETREELLERGRTKGAQVIILD
jgi:3D (Asp-Asp-Asp) domain-containing protein